LRLCLRFVFTICVGVSFPFHNLSGECLPANAAAHLLPPRDFPFSNFHMWFSLLSYQFLARQPTSSSSWFTFFPLFTACTQDCISSRPKRVDSPECSFWNRGNLAHLGCVPYRSLRGYDTTISHKSQPSRAFAWLFPFLSTSLRLAIKFLVFIFVQTRESSAIKALATLFPLGTKKTANSILLIKRPQARKNPSPEIQTLRSAWQRNLLNKCGIKRKCILKWYVRCT